MLEKEPKYVTQDNCFPIFFSTTFMKVVQSLNENETNENVHKQIEHFI